MQPVHLAAVSGKGGSNGLGFGRVPSVHRSLAGEISNRGLYGLSPHAGSASAMASVLGLSARSMGSASASISGIDRYNYNRNRQGQLQQGLDSILPNETTTPNLPANGAGIPLESDSQAGLAGHSTLHAPASESLSQTATIPPHNQRETQGKATAVT